MGDERSGRTRRMYHLDAVDRIVCDDMPDLDPVDVLPASLRAFNTCARITDHGAGVHFFLDDYRFENVWRNPYRYVSMLERFGCVMTPDFSCYLDMPRPMQLWNVYRSRVVGRIWQDAGLLVVPTLTWGDTDTYPFAWLGVPSRSTVCVSSVGLLADKEGRELFQRGASEACRALEPMRVLAYGREADFDAHGAEVVWYGSAMQDRFEAMRRERREAASA